MRSKQLFLADRNQLLGLLRSAARDTAQPGPMSLPRPGWRMVLVPFGPKNDIINGKTQCGS